MADSIQNVQHFYGMNLLNEKIEELSSPQYHADIESRLEAAYQIDSANHLRDQKISDLRIKLSRELKELKQNECVKNTTAKKVYLNALFTSGLYVASGCASTVGGVISDNSKNWAEGFGATAKGTDQIGSVFKSFNDRDKTISQFGKSNAEEVQKRMEQSRSEARQKSQKSLSKADDIGRSKLQAMR